MVYRLLLPEDRITLVDLAKEDAYFIHREALIGKTFTVANATELKTWIRVSVYLDKPLTIGNQRQHAGFKMTFARAKFKIADEPNDGTL